MTPEQDLLAFRGEKPWSVRPGPSQQASRQAPTTRNVSLLAGSLTTRAARHGFFLDAGCPALQTAQVVELGTAHSAATSYFQGFDQRRVKREYALYANSAASHAAHGKVGRWSGSVLAPYYHALKGLDTLTVAFSDSEVDPDSVAGAKIRNVRIALWL